MSLKVLATAHATAVGGRNGHTESDDKLVSVDLSPYLTPGLNVIQYNPVGRSGSATVSVLVR